MDTNTNTNTNEKFFVICVAPRVVLAGYATREELDKERPVLRNAQMCVYWHSTLRGVFGLASQGPGSECQISKPIPAQVICTQIETIMETTPEAEKAWLECPWG